MSGLRLSQRVAFPQTRALPVRQALQFGRLERHRHRSAYMSVVVDGAYVEAGDQGFTRMEPSAVAVHGAWDAHLNQVGRRGAAVLNLEVPMDMDPGLYRVESLDEVVRLAESGDGRAAVATVARDAIAVLSRATDWPELLVAQINTDPAFSLSDWAERHGLSASGVSCGFRRRYGVSPKRFRAEAKARRAWSLLVNTHTPFAQVAMQAGFADQAHMTRSVCALTGRAPGLIRALGDGLE